MKGDAHSAIRGMQVIKLIIWKDGPKYKVKAKGLIEKLMQWQKEEGDDIDNVVLHMMEIEANEILLTFL
jgi:hypothetical protein